MNNSKLIELLKTFSPEDLKSFGKFLNSPFLKPPRNVLKFFDYLVKYFPKSDPKYLEKEKVFEKLFPGKKYNERTLVNLMFDLTKSAEKFLAYNTLLNDDSEYLLSLSQAYLDNKLPKHFIRVTEAIEDELVPGFSVKKAYMSQFRRLTQQKNLYYTEVNDIENLVESQMNYFEASAIHFVMDYINICGSKIPAKKNIGKDVDNKFIQAISNCFNIEEFLETILKDEMKNNNDLRISEDGTKKNNRDSKTKNLKNRKEYSNRTYIGIPYYILKILNNPEDTAHYYRLKEFFYDNLADENTLLDREEKNSIFNYLTNYCMQRYPDLKFVKELFEIYKCMLDNDAYSESENEYLQTNLFRNILKVGISLKEFDWVENFIEKYSEMLSPEFQNDMKNLSSAHLHFVKEEYGKSLEFIMAISENFAFNKTDIRNLRLKLFYELDHTEPAFSLVTSYKQFLLKTDLVSEENKIVYSNFIKFYLQLLKIKSGDSDEDPLNVKSLIEKETNIVNKQWLIEKAEELSKK